MVRAALVVLAAILVMLMLVTAALAQGTPEVSPTPDNRAEAAWDGTYRRIHVPILMYHYVGDLPDDADATRTDLTISAEMFRAHMEYLLFHGYTPISLYALNDALLTGRALPAEPVVLTFDDGYRDHYENVFPVLREYGYTATFFIITGTADANDPNHLLWDQIREMADAGMDMESHTKTHPDLRGRDYDFLVYQLLGSMESLAAYTGHIPHFFSYPIGRYDDTTLSILGALPVWRAVTTERGALHTTDNRLELARVRIHNSTGVTALAQILRES